MANRIFAAMARPIRIPALAVILLALSAIAGNLAQYEEKGDLKELANLDNAQAECRARIGGYVEGLSIQLDIGLGDGILDRIGPNDDAVYEAARAEYAHAVAGLRQAREYRERSVEVCAADPDFDPTTDIPEESTT